MTPTQTVDSRIDAATGAVLLVEDEEVLRKAVASLLQRRGFVVIEASDGAAAIGLLRTRHSEIDAILLDVTLPGISSREVFEEARLLRPRPPSFSPVRIAKKRSISRLPGLLWSVSSGSPFKWTT